MAKLVTRGGITEHEVVSRHEWLSARKKLLEEEKELFRLHDRLKAHRRNLPPEEVAGEGYFNYRRAQPWGTDVVGISVFSKDEAERVFHTCSCYSRGVDMMNGAYHYLDLTPQGRDEEGQGANPQAWVRRHDEYGE